MNQESKKLAKLMAEELLTATLGVDGLVTCPTCDYINSTEAGVISSVASKKIVSCRKCGEEFLAVRD